MPPEVRAIFNSIRARAEKKREAKPELRTGESEAERDQRQAKRVEFLRQQAADIERDEKLEGPSK